jgi:hypothetical protein
MKIILIVEDLNSISEKGTINYRNIELVLTPDQKEQIHLSEYENIFKIKLID